MTCPRSSAFLRSAARRLLAWADKIGPDATTQALDIAYRPHPMTAEAMAMRAELEAEARAEFGVRSIPDPVCQVCGAPLDLLTISSGGRCTNEDCSVVGMAVPAPPGPASPGDVWPQESNVASLTPYGRAIRRGKR